MQNKISKPSLINRISIKNIFTLAAAIRLLLLIFGYVQDNYLGVKYTDIDYKVYTDAARLVHEGYSPYDRLTYRYTPLLSWLMIPNVSIFDSFGKVVFCVSDMLVGVLMNMLMTNLEENNKKFMLSIWLLNPLVFNISTRGNADTIIVLLVLWASYLVISKSYLNAGVIFGLAIHFKIYPIIYALTFFLYIDMKKEGHTGFKDYINSFITKNRVVFAVSTIATFIVLLAVFYAIYGYIFVYETYLYHLVRRDNRHNFSLYFYPLYLLFESSYSTLIGLAAFIPQWSLVFFISFRYHSDLFFAMLVQTWIFVVYNKVCTAQYFIWYISLFPLGLKNNRLVKDKIGYGIVLVVVWFATEVFWLFWGVPSRVPWRERIYGAVDSMLPLLHGEYRSDPRDNKISKFENKEYLI